MGKKQKVLVVGAGDIGSRIIAGLRPGSPGPQMFIGGNLGSFRTGLSPVAGTGITEGDIRVGEVSMVTASLTGVPKQPPAGIC